MASNKVIDEIDLLEVCRRYLAGGTPADTMAWLANHLERDERYKREYVYQLLRRASAEGLLRLNPSPELELSHRIQTKFPYAESRYIEVCQSSQELALDTLPDVAAKKIVELIERVAEAKPKKGRVHLGIGGGATVRATCRAIARMLMARTFSLDLTVHTLSTGFDPKHPLGSPITVLSEFEGTANSVEYVGLFAPAAVPTRQYKAVTETPAVKECIDEAKKIDIVVTSLARAKDEHGELNRFIEHVKSGPFDVADAKRKLTSAGWIADVGYCPVSADGPIEINYGMRPVSLFDIERLIEHAASDGKYVVLVAGPCATCKAPKTEALRPLLASPNLQLFSHLITSMDNVQPLFESPVETA